MVIVMPGQAPRPNPGQQRNQEALISSCLSKVCAIAWRLLIGGILGGSMASIPSMTGSLHYPEEVYSATVIPGVLVSVLVGCVVEVVTWKLYMTEREGGRTGGVESRAKEPINSFVAILAWAIGGGSACIGLVQYSARKSG